MSQVPKSPPPLNSQPPNSRRLAPATHLPARPSHAKVDAHQDGQFLEDPHAEDLLSTEAYLAELFPGEFSPAEPMSPLGTSIGPRGPLRLISQGRSYGIWTTQALRDCGLSPTAIQKQVAEGELRRLRKGVYADRSARDDVIAAARMGVGLTCLSASKLHNLWVPRTSIDHHAVRSGLATRGLLEPNACITRVDRHMPIVASLEESLAHVCQRHDAETAIIVIESALNRDLLSPAGLERLTRKMPPALAAISHFITDLSESGSETRVRLYLQRLQVPVSVQVPIPGVGRVDLVVGRSLIIEADSRAHHSQEADYLKDRSRDLAAMARGYRVVRLSFHQIWNDWNNTAAILTRLIRTRAHLKSPTPLPSL